MESVYKITINKWFEHNPKHKKGYCSFMFYNGFFSDPKIAQLSPIDVVLLIYLFTVASESSSNTVEIHVKSLPKQFRIRAQSLHNSLTKFVELQLVTVEKMPSLIIELKELKRKNRNELNFHAGEKEESPTNVITIKNPDLNRKIWEAYSSAYFLRYHVEPVRNQSVNSKISQIAKRLGTEAPEVVRFFVQHPDAFYVKSLHAIGLCLRDAEALRTQWANGKAITSAHIRDYEKHHERQELLRSIERDGI